MSVKNDHQLAQQVVDGSIGHEEFKAFQSRMRQESGLVDLYHQYALLNHVLHEEFEGQHALAAPIMAKGRRFSLIIAGLAAAAVITLVVTVNMRSPKSRPAAAVPFALATFSEDAVWKIEGEQHASGQSARISQGAIIRLQQGQARITLKSGADAVIDGNTELELASNEQLHLGHGRARFRLSQSGGKFAVATTSLNVIDLGTEFGMESHPGKPDEIHVFEGKVELQLPTTETHPVIAAGDAVRLMEGNVIEHIPVSMARFPQSAPRFVHILEDRFSGSGEIDRRKPKQGAGNWRLTQGKPEILSNRLESENFAVFFKLQEPSPSQHSPILLATLETLKPLHGEFHTDGWAGMSFYHEGRELLFFGDGYGPERTWSIDVKQRLPIVLPSSPVIGPRTVTLCYNRNTGAASLHEGSLPLGPAFVSGTLPTGMEFDEIRIGASAGAALALRSLTVRTGESAEQNR